MALMSRKSGAGDAPIEKAGLADMVSGERKSFSVELKPYLSQELVGGAIPYIAGKEDEAVWNAAAQACGTERVHYTYSVDEGRVWYLACPSASLSSHPDSWCPLAAALPGNSAFWDKEIVYLYEQEGWASALRWDPETGRMQVFLGAARTLLPRIQSMDANFVQLKADTLKPIPWQNRQLRTEELSRTTVKALLYSGLLINLIAIMVLVGQYVMTNFVERDLASVRAETDRVSSDLMLNAHQALQSDMINHMVRVQELVDYLGGLDGTLVKYEVNRGNVTWEALVPQAFGSCTGPLRGCQLQPGLERDGRVRIKGTR